MDKISSLPDELLVKILSFIPTKDAVSTSILSKRWERLWMWVPKLECDCSEPELWDFIVKNLPLRAQIVETLCLRFRTETFQPEDFKLWVGIAVSSCLRELSIDYWGYKPDLLSLLPSSLYTCESLVTLKLNGSEILVDLPEKVCLSSLKTLQLVCVTYSKEDSLRLLLSYCPVLEDLAITLIEDDNVTAVVVILPSLQRLTLSTENDCLSDEYVIVTPSLKYFKLEDTRQTLSYSIEHMPKLEEANISVEQDIVELLEPITNVKRLSLNQMFNDLDGSAYLADIVFSQLEHLKLCICDDFWSKLVVYFLKSSPNLRVLNLYVDSHKSPRTGVYERINWKNSRSSVPVCLRRSLETLEFAGYAGRPEERDFLSFIFKNACCLKSISLTA